jgi:CRP-like cAMP-binding protein
MTWKPTTPFNPKTFLTKVGSGKTIFKFEKNAIIFSQGDAADAVFYIQNGKVKLTVVSQQGKEAVVAILEPASFFGEACLAGETFRMATVTAIEDATILRIDKQAMIDVLQKEPAFSALFMGYPRRFGGSTLQFKREATGQDSAPLGPLRQRQTTRDRHCKDQSGNTGRNGRYHAFARQFLSQ